MKPKREIGIRSFKSSLTSSSTLCNLNVSPTSPCSVAIWGPGSVIADLQKVDSRSSGCGEENLQAYLSVPVT